MEEFYTNLHHSTVKKKRTKVMIHKIVDDGVTYNRLEEIENSIVRFLRKLLQNNQVLQDNTHCHIPYMISDK